MNYHTPYVFIISAGRAGSTIFQYLLNSDPRVLIRGENNNFFFHTYKTYEALMEESHPEPQPNQPWYGFHNFSPKAYQNAIRKLGHEFLLGSKNSLNINVLGFKEIRLFDLFNEQDCGRSSICLKDTIYPEKVLNNYILYLGDIFPSCKVIFLTRNPDEIMASGWWKNPRYCSKKLQNDLERFQDACKHMAASSGSLHIDYSCLRLRRYDDIRRLVYDPLGLPFCEKTCEKILDCRLNHCK